MRMVALLAMVVLMAVPAASAQTAQPERPRPQRIQIEKSMKAIVAADVGRHNNQTRGKNAVLLGATGSRLPTGARAVLTAMGVIGGMFGGAALGAKLEGDCHCDDPGLQGALIGMPLGAIGGGILVWVLSGR